MSLETFTKAMNRNRRRIVDGDGVDGCVAGCGDAFWREAVVKNCAVVRNDAGKRDCLIKEVRYALMRHGMMSQVMVKQVAYGHEWKAIRSEAEIGEGAGAPSVECKADSKCETRRRRQRRPTAIIIGISPTHPGW